MAMTTQEQFIYDLFNTLWFDHDTSVITQHFAEDVLIESPIGVTIGTAGKISIVEYWQKAFPKFNGGIDRVLSHGGQVALRWSTIAKQESEFCGVPATGKYFSFYGNTAFYIRNKKIVEYKAVTNVGDAFAAKGLTLKLLPKQTNYAAMINAVRYVQNVRLNNREVEVFALLLAGLSELEIANLFGIQLLASKELIETICSKLKINMQDLPAVAEQEGTANIFLKIAVVLQQSLWRSDKAPSMTINEAC